MSAHLLCKAQWLRNSDQQYVPGQCADACGVQRLARTRGTDVAARLALQFLSALCRFVIL